MYKGGDKVRYLIKFSYDGTAYKGFQTQKGHNTIQERLEEALTKIKESMQWHNMGMLI